MSKVNLIVTIAALSVAAFICSTICDFNGYNVVQIHIDYMITALVLRFVFKDLAYVFVEGKEAK